jgi:hypothetical protein
VIGRHLNDNDGQCNLEGHAIDKGRTKLFHTNDGGCTEANILLSFMAATQFLSLWL